MAGNNYIICLVFGFFFFLLCLYNGEIKSGQRTRNLFFSMMKAEVAEHQEDYVCVQRKNTQQTLSQLVYLEFRIIYKPCVSVTRRWSLCSCHKPYVAISLKVSWIHQLNPQINCFSEFLGPPLEDELIFCDCCVDFTSAYHFSAHYHFNEECV